MVNKQEVTAGLISVGIAYDRKADRFQPRADICHTASGQHMGALVIENAATHYGFRAYCHSCGRHVTKEVARVIGYRFGGGQGFTRQAEDRGLSSASGMIGLLGEKKPSVVIVAAPEGDEDACYICGATEDLEGTDRWNRKWCEDWDGCGERAGECLTGDLAVV